MCCGLMTTMCQRMTCVGLAFVVVGLLISFLTLLQFLGIL
jgi:hypothetical protein